MIVEIQKKLFNSRRKVNSDSAQVTSLRHSIYEKHFHIHRVSKNVPPLACYNFDIHEWILIFFGRNVTDKVGNQTTLYYATLNNLCFCTTWQMGKRENHICYQLDCVTHNAPVRCLSGRKSCHLECV